MSIAQLGQLLLILEDLFVNIYSEVVLTSILIVFVDGYRFIIYLTSLLSVKNVQSLLIII